MGFTESVTSLFSRSFDQIKCAKDLASDAKKCYENFFNDKNHLMAKVSYVWSQGEASSAEQELFSDNLNEIHQISFTKSCRHAAVLFVGTIALSLSFLVAAVTLPLLVPSLILTGKLGSFVSRLKVATELIYLFKNYIVSPNSESIAKLIRMNRAEYIHALDRYNLIEPEIASEVLGLAIQTGSGDAVVKKLLDRCDYRVNVKDENGNTPLMIAVQQKNHYIFKELLKLEEDEKKVADINAQNNNGETALVLAVNGYNDDMARELFDRGARVDLLDQKRQNITQLALEEAIQYFQENTNEHGEADFKALLYRVKHQLRTLEENTQVSAIEELKEAAAVIFYRPLTAVPRVLWSLASDGFRRASTYLRTA